MKTTQEWHTIIYSAKMPTRGFPYTVFNAILADMEELEKLVDYFREELAICEANKGASALPEEE